MEPKSNSRRTEIEDKNEVEKEYLEDHLGGVLGRSWVVLGTLETPQTLRLPIFREN